MATTSESIIKLYISTFNRAPDASGLTYWTNKIDTDGWSIETVAQSFFDQSETQTTYPTSLSTSDFIDKVYQNVLDRTPDDDGKTYWTSQLDTNAISKNNFIIAVMNGATGDDETLLTNKTTVGSYFAETLKLEDTTMASDCLKYVTTDTTTVERANIDLDAFNDDFSSDILRNSLDTSANTFNGTDANDWIYANSGNDVIYTGDGASMVFGDAGDDRIYGYDKVDVLHGGDGNDTIYGGKEADIIFGDGDDDSLHGEAGDNTLYGDDGDDYLYGGANNDTLWGGTGNDTITASAGDDFVYGESGNDWIDAGDGVNFVDGGSGNDTIFGGSGVDQLYGGEDADTLYGLASNDTLDGMNGNDTIYGGAGDDTIVGNNGDDILYGNDGSDTLKGQTGEDTLQGGAGADTLSGGSGNDTFVFELLDSTTTTIDTITDFTFSISGADKITFVNKGSETIQESNIDVSSATSLANALTIVTAASDSNGTNAMINWFYYEDNTYIYEDMTNGAYSSTGDIIIQLQGILDLNGLDSDTFNFQ